jgi:carbonic anhydrase
MSVTDDLLRNAEFWHQTFDRAGLAVQPALHTTILTCMDSRLNPYAMFGLREGQVHMIRNAGGIVTEDVIRSLTLSQRFLQTREIIVIMHTNCGLEARTEEQFVDEITEAVGEKPHWHFGATDDLAATVRDSVQQLRDCRFLEHRDAIRGFVYDVETGALTEVA